MSRINQCYYAPGIAKRTKPSSVQKVQKVQKGWRGGLQSDRQSHRLVITRSRLTKPHDSAVSHEPPYMCAEATLIAFVICAAATCRRWCTLCTACDASTSRIATSLRRPSRPWLLPRHHNNEISFLFLFAFPFLLFCLPPNVFPFLFASQCQSRSANCRSRSRRREVGVKVKCRMFVVMLSG